MKKKNMKKKTKTMMKKRSNLYTEEEIAAALQLIQLRYSLKNDKIISCSASSHAFDLVDNNDEDGGEAVGSARKSKKFRSVAELYNVTKPL